LINFIAHEAFIGTVFQKNSVNPAILILFGKR
jgi:hypothetical protein